MARRQGAVHPSQRRPQLPTAACRNDIVATTVVMALVERRILSS
ncbi:hypothetical protein BV133_1423 [Blastochloris viridis]|uniref:Uncharacterized protein n=1 Tax=Blastochloris viridis TaxID=1079 RepID=A0A182D0H9_BLAVI|nr:hypothetical protein BV133_1423 [Blastochloris viridis]